jgi:DNA (cytosine-5)-methyltransferase 1
MASDPTPLPIRAAPFSFIDLFAGVGGFHHALSGPGFGGECKLAVEFDPDCEDVYREAFPGTPLKGNIRSITQNHDGSDASPDEIRDRVPEHDVLCAGFPCQPFSKSGGQLGLRDQTRGTLFFDIMEIVRARLPRFLVLENVPNLAGPRHRETWSMIIKSLRQTGYRVSSTPVILSPHRLPPELGGSPQVRDRVFILAVHDPSRAHLDEPPIVQKRPVADWDPRQWRVDAFLHPEDPGPAYAIRPAERTWLRAWDAFLKGIEAEDLPGFPIWVDAWVESPLIEPDTPPWKADFLRKNSKFYLMHRRFLDGWLEEVWDDHGTTVRDFPLSRRKFEWQARLVHPGRKGRTLWDLLIHLRPSGIRVKPPTYFPALVAITQTSIVGSLGRRITPREAAGLQQIPYEPFLVVNTPHGEVYRQLGNAVNVGAVRFVASRLFRHAGVSWGLDLDPTEQLVLLSA